MTRLRILALEPYLARSHEQFLDGLASHSRHRLECATLPARKWKWRMRTSAIHYARLLEERSEPVDLFFASDYVNLGELRSLLPSRFRDVPVVLYFHENQLTYPLQEGEFLDYQYAMIHLYGMLAADRVVFNSDYHRRELLDALRDLVRLVPDLDLRPDLDAIEARSSVLPIGLDLPRPDRGAVGDPPVIVWNHRWEYDKNPAGFLEALAGLESQKRPFRLRLLGQRFRTLPTEFREILDRWPNAVIESEYPESYEEYVAALRQGDIAISTAIHEFFGVGTLEALRCGLHPVLPNDLAYPELLPEEFRGFGLYPRERGPVDALAAAIDRVRRPSWLAQREALQRSTDRFEWPQLAPRYDTLFEEVASAGRA
ncbi:MAG: DUF3524 domain-containing protein [Planctomycetota bacterium]